MIVPTADRTKATVMVKVAFQDKDPRILPEMSAKVAFLSRPVQAGETAPFKAVGVEALVNRNGRDIVFRMAAGRALETPVRPGRKMNSVVEVLEGLEVGDKVVLNPPSQVKNGTKIAEAEL
jgi:hypothetical protein